MALQLDVTAAPPHTCEDAAEDWRGETLTMESLCMSCYKNVGSTLRAYCFAEFSACVNLNNVLNYFSVTAGHNTDAAHKSSALP